MIVQLFMADFYPMIDEKSEELFGKEIFTDEQKQVEKETNSKNGQSSVHHQKI